VKTGNDDPLTADRRQNAKEKQLEEKKRLLYVALTRAEDRLYICGWEGKRRRPAECWYDLIDPAFGEGVEEVELPWGEVARRWSSGNVVEKKDVQEIAPVKPAPLPDWVFRPAPEEPTPPRPLVPSREEDETVASSPLGPDDGRRFHRGLLVHRLLETLPSIDQAQREAAGKAWLARPVHALEETQQEEILRETLAVINDPGFSAIFGPGSQAEVPISGLIDGRVLSGQIDRLLVGEEEILVIDYKTNRPSPTEISAVPALYIRQMSLYRRALMGMYPGKVVRCALLWTEGPHLMELPEALL
jgi:ATP-dependent helicase/nuclease subunit A